jgi:P pilus assembly chaperone PapD
MSAHRGSFAVLVCAVITFVAWMSVAAPARAGLVAAGTRVIYQEGQHERTIAVANRNAWQVMVETWADDGGGDPQRARAPFVILPPVFRLHPEGLQVLRIVYNGDALPRDRESVFWLNLYEIPPDPGSRAKSVPHLDLAMDTQFKIFYRPKGLKSSPDDVARQLHFTLRRDGDHVLLVCHNPTPYHASFSRIALVAGETRVPVAPVPDMMTAPFAERAYDLSEAPQSLSGAQVTFTLLDDNGSAQEHTMPLDDARPAP